jgi:hypothetical protein
MHYTFLFSQVNSEDVLLICGGEWTASGLRGENIVFGEAERGRSNLCSVAGIPQDSQGARPRPTASAGLAVGSGSALERGRVVARACAHRDLEGEG